MLSGHCQKKPQSLPPPPTLLPSSLPILPSLSVATKSLIHSRRALSGGRPSLRHHRRRSLVAPAPRRPSLLLRRRGQLAAPPLRHQRRRTPPTPLCPATPSSCDAGAIHSGRSGGRPSPSSSAPSDARAPALPRPSLLLAMLGRSSPACSPRRRGPPSS